MAVKHEKEADTFSYQLTFEDFKSVNTISSYVTNIKCSDFFLSLYAETQGLAGICFT